MKWFWFWFSFWMFDSEDWIQFFRMNDLTVRYVELWWVQTTTSVIAALDWRIRMKKKSLQTSKWMNWIRYNLMKNEIECWMESISINIEFKCLLSSSYVHIFRYWMWTMHDSIVNGSYHGIIIVASVAPNFIIGHRYCRRSSMTIFKSKWENPLSHSWRISTLCLDVQ